MFFLWLCFLFVLAVFGIDASEAPDHGGVGCLALSTRPQVPAAVSGGKDAYYRRVYFNANMSVPLCGNRAPLGDDIVFPMFADGCAAGPVLEKCRADDPSACSAVDELLKLSAIQDVRAGRALQFFLPFHPTNVSVSVILDRVRRSSATGLVFLDDSHFVVASYGMKRLHLYEYSLERLYAKWLSSCPASGNPDLLDYDGKGMIVASQLLRGTQELYRVDLEAKTVVPIKEVYAFVGEEGPRRQWCHEVTFYPSANTTVFVASSSRSHYPAGLMIRFFDFAKERVLAEFRMASHPVTRGFKAQGFRFLDDQHFIADVTTFVINGFSDDALCRNPLVPPEARTQTRLVIFKLKFSVHDLLRDGGHVDDALSVVAHFDIGVGSSDGLAYQDGLVVIADQFSDRVHRFHVNLSDTVEPIRRLSTIGGYHLPHGVAFSNYQRHMAVTCYGDNSVIIQKIPNQK
jgi:hypothetical protein